MDSFLPVGHALPQHVTCRWLISLDFDGTLWQGDAAPPIPPAFFELMLQWRTQGVRWGINTGRTMAYLFDDLASIAPFLPDFICTCERFVYLADAEGELQPHVSHNEAANRAAAHLQQKMQPLLHAELDKIRRIAPHLEWIIAPTDPLSVEAADGATMDDLAALLQPLMTQHPDVSMQRAGRYMRLADSRFHKGSALAHVAEEWQISNDCLLIMGDGHNDIDAFSRFPGAFCAAPADAHPEVQAWIRANGGYISTEPGVMQVLHHWCSLFSPLSAAR
ncbi:MAG: HAD hydrolase family protein [Akkermansia sp.]|nr:HAD hydrolase family protein [Akkermansia sp.]